MGAELAADYDETCVALDLETTGLSVESDEIIEVGAVRFKGEQVLETFQTFVNPYKRITPFIRDLTGISQDDLDNAPGFATVHSDLREFIGASPIVGQNVAFDLGFLEKNHINLSNPSYDTQELASILLPSLKRYSLSSLAQSFAIEHIRPHRALDDALVTHSIFSALKAVAMKMESGMILRLHEIYEKAPGHLARWFSQLISLGSSANRPGHAFGGSSGVKSKFDGDTVDYKRSLSSMDGGLADIGSLVTENWVRDFFLENGPIANVLGGYRYRPQQLKVAEAVAEAINNKSNLLVEAGTGVGKSLAYLVPAILLASTRGTRVVVSTNTIALQEQLVNRDIPSAVSSLATWDPQFSHFKFSQLKGRDNYLCLDKWKQIIQQDRLSSDEARVTAKILLWLQNTTSGDRAELNLNFRDAEVWNRISSADSIQCPEWLTGNCFLKSAREQAEESTLVVVNHALLMRDVMDNGNLIPAYDYLIVDEAHQLEEEATRQFGLRLSEKTVHDHEEKLSVDRGVYQRLSAIYGQMRFESSGSVLNDTLSQADVLLANLREKSSAFWNTLAIFLKDHNAEIDGRQLVLRITHNSRKQPGWSQVEIAWENLNSVLSEVDRNLNLASQVISGISSVDPILRDSLVGDILGCLSASAESKNYLRSFVVQDDIGLVYWITQEGRAGVIVLNVAPLRVADTLKQALFSQKKSVILTSATLTTQGHFQHMNDRLGTEDFHELLVDSPFDYPNAAMLYLPRDTPGPTGLGYQEALESAILDVGRAAIGRTLVLFTSHASLQTTRLGIRETLDKYGIQLLAQGIDGSPSNLVDDFMRNPESVLLGTAALWEGVDIPGGILKALVIARLPFRVPTEPVFAARSELFQDPFNEYALPQSILRFRQGFGRLIRGEQDRGIVVILDQRIVSRPYGSVFLDSIPECNIVTGYIRDIPEVSKRWLSR